MGPYKGDYPTDFDPLVFMFDSFSSDDPSASVTLTGLAVTDIEVYKGESMTQRSSDAGYTLLDTDGIDLDGTTGIHGFSIDLSDNTDAGFFAAGNEYNVIVAGVTIDGATVNFHAGSFSIERAGGVLALLKGTNSLADIESKLDTIDTNVDSILVDTAEIGAAGAGLTALATQASVNTIDTNVDAILVDTADLQANQGNWLTATGFSTHSAADVADAVLDEALAGHVTAGSLGKAVADIETDAAAILVDTADLQANQGNWLTATGFATSAALATVDTNVDAILVDTGTTLPATLTTIEGKVDTVDGVVDTILVDTADLQANQGNWLTATGFATSAALATVDTNVDAILVDTGTTLPATLSTIDGKVDTIDTNVDAILVDTGTTIPGLIADTHEATVTKNAAFSDFTFPMKLTSDHYSAATSKTVTGERSLDAGAFVSVDGTITEISDGVYQFDALAADTNGDTVTWKFSATDCDDTIVTFKTSD